MTRLHFKPMPWLTVFSMFGLILLLKLGFWQKERLAWKLDILDRVEAAAESPPFESLTEIIDALEAGEPVDYRRFEGQVTTTERFKYWTYIPLDGQFGFRDFSRVRDDGVTIYKASALVVADPVKYLSAIKLAQFTETETRLEGYVRLAPEPPSWIGRLIKNKPDPEANRWYGFNQDDLWEDEKTNMRVWIDSRNVRADTDLPPMRPDIRNNHWQYMWTWWSFAGLLVIFYILLHRRAGRLRLR